MRRYGNAIIMYRMHAGVDPNGNNTSSASIVTNNMG